MIEGSKPIAIAEYLPMDRCAEGYSFIKPLEGQEFQGIPYGFLTAYSKPFIEIYQNNVLVGSVNCDDVSEIIFKKGES